MTAKNSFRSFRPAALAVVLVFLAGASAAHAARPVTATQAPDAILTQVNKIHAEAVAGKRGWDNISAEKKTQLTTARDRVVALLDGKKKASDLQETERVELAQVLDNINTLAKEADDERMVCTRERAVGSNFPIETCMTVAERRRQREADQTSTERSRMR